mgnify:CR=1 FL=1
MGWHQSTGLEGSMNDLSRITVLDAAGSSVGLESLWRQHRAVVVFVRHFG